MMRFFASLLLALAMLLSPMVMEMSGGVAKAHTTDVSRNSECAGMGHASPDRTADVQRNCAAACAALPALAAGIDVRAVPRQVPAIAAPSQPLTGIWPEGETPPPRGAPQI